MWLFHRCLVKIHIRGSPSKTEYCYSTHEELGPGKGSAARMKKESEWEKDTELEKKPRELAGDIGWVGVCIVASASELNCCHPHTFKSFRASRSSKPGFLGCR